MTQAISKGLGTFLDGNNSACFYSCFRRISVANNIGPYAEFLLKFNCQSDPVRKILKLFSARFKAFEYAVIHSILTITTLNLFESRYPV